MPSLRPALESREIFSCGAPAYRLPVGLRTGSPRYGKSHDLLDDCIVCFNQGESSACPVRWMATGTVPRLASGQTRLDPAALSERMAFYRAVSGP